MEERIQKLEKELERMTKLRAEERQSRIRFQNELEKMLVMNDNTTTSSTSGDPIVNDDDGDVESKSKGQKRFRSDDVGEVEVEIEGMDTMELGRRKTREGDRDREDTEYHFKPIGHLESCFIRRNGCPRQPFFVTQSRARLKLLNRHNPRDSLDQLHLFSHCILIWVFHENTSNVTRKLAAKNLNNNSKGISEVKSKIRPPRLEGKPVGLFATRTPHRPNPIGLSVCRITHVDYNTGTLHLSEIDLIDGTPILDVKPYVPGYDNLDSSFLKSPEWIHEPIQSVDRLSVRWSSTALEQVSRLFSNPKKNLRLFGISPSTSSISSSSSSQAEADFIEFVTQVCSLDMRSKGKKKKASSPSSSSSPSSVITSLLVEEEKDETIVVDSHSVELDTSLIRFSLRSTGVIFIDSVELRVSLTPL